MYQVTSLRTKFWRTHLTLENQSGTLCVEGIDWLVSCRSTESLDRGHGAHHHRLRDHEIHKEVES